QNPVERPRADDRSYEEYGGERNPANCQSCRGLNIELHGFIVSVRVQYSTSQGCATLLPLPLSSRRTNLNQNPKHWYKCLNHQETREHEEDQKRSAQEPSFVLARFFVVCTNLCCSDSVHAFSNNERG